MRPLGGGATHLLLPATPAIAPAAAAVLLVRCSRLTRAARLAGVSVRGDRRRAAERGVAIRRRRLGARRWCRELTATGGRRGLRHAWRALHGRRGAAIGWSFAIRIVFPGLVGAHRSTWAGSAATTGGTPAFVHAMLKVRVKARGISQRRIRVVRRALVLAAVAPLPGTALAFGPRGGWPRGSRAVTVWCDATRCCASIVRRRGSLTRGRAMVLQGRGASSRLVHPSQTGHWDCHASLLGKSDAKRGRTTGHHEYRQCARFAQPTRPGCELRARRDGRAPSATPHDASPAL